MRLIKPLSSSHFWTSGSYMARFAHHFESAESFLGQLIFGLMNQGEDVFYKSWDCLCLSVFVGVKRVDSHAKLGDVNPGVQ